MKCFRLLKDEKIKKELLELLYLIFFQTISKQATTKTSNMDAD